MSFCDISAGLPKQALTHDLHDNYGNLVVKPGLPKLSLLPESIAEPSADKTYYDFGVINNSVEPIIIMGLYHHRNLIGSPSAFSLALSK